MLDTLKVGLTVRINPSFVDDRDTLCPGFIHTPEPQPAGALHRFAGLRLREWDQPTQSGLVATEAAVSIAVLCYFAVAAAALLAVR